MAAVESLQKESASVSLPGLGRALISVGKLTQQSAEDIVRKSHSNKTRFIAELTTAGAVTPADLASTLSAVFGAPLLDLDAIDPIRLPRNLLDPKICLAYRVVVLSKRNNRLTLATADPTDHEAAEKIKFSTQMGVDWVIAEYDKLTRFVESSNISAGQAIDAMGAGSEDFDFEDMATPEATTETEASVNEVEDAPIVRFLHKMLLDAFNMRASDLHFEPYEHHYRVRFRVDGELREIASPPIAIKDKLASRIKVISRLDISEKRVPQDGRMKLKVAPGRVIGFSTPPAPRWALRPWATSQKKRSACSKPLHGPTE